VARFTLGYVSLVVAVVEPEEVVVLVRVPAEEGTMGAVVEGDQDGIAGQISAMHVIQELHGKAREGLVDLSVHKRMGLCQVGQRSRPLRSRAMQAACKTEREGTWHCQPACLFPPRRPMR
jgi:hypothetical protein